MHIYTFWDISNFVFQSFMYAGLSVSINFRINTDSVSRVRGRLLFNSFFILARLRSGGKLNNGPGN